MTDNIEVFIQNSIRVKTEQGYVYIDPFRMEEAPHDAAVILITHDHYDHFSPEDIKKVAGNETVMVVPEKMAKKAKDLEKLVCRIEMVQPGGSYIVSGVDLETVPAYNLLKPFHPKMAGWVGYILKTGGKRIYIAGDTDATDEARAVSCDIALLPIGGTYTMDAKKAAALANEIMPQTVIPVHFGHLVGKPSDGEDFARLVKDPVNVEFKINF